MEKKQREIKKLSTDENHIAALTVVVSKYLTGSMTGMNVEVRDGDILTDRDVDPVVVQGSIELIRTHFHAKIDEIFDIYTEKLENMVKKINRPVTWNPKGRTG